MHYIKSAFIIKDLFSNLETAGFLSFTKKTLKVKAFFSVV